MTDRDKPSRHEEIRTRRVNTGDSELVILSLPAARLEALTEAERQVCELALLGLSNAEIAERRQASPRTVANQLAAVYRKLRVTSRHELAAKLL